MKVGNKTVKIFKMKNRKGFAALCTDHVTEGATRQQAAERMEKALSRTDKKKATAKKTKKK